MSPGIDTTVAHSARRNTGRVQSGENMPCSAWCVISNRLRDYHLVGRDNFAVDRAVGDEVMAAYPGIVESVRANRAFLARVVRFLATHTASSAG